MTSKDARASGGWWSGYLMSGAVYRLPGSFQFTDASPTHLSIVWARSQTEVAHTAATARTRICAS